MKHQILIVDDEPGIRFGVREFLQANGYEVLEAANCQEAENVFRLWSPDLALLDHRLPDGDSLEALQEHRPGGAAGGADRLRFD
jgi:DNA-binding response OmpR family regulator